MRVAVVRLLVLCAFVAIVAAWSKEDHEIFRLRDEVAAFEGLDVTFYDFVGIKNGASQDEINKAYRKKSRLIHPDKAKQSFIAEQSTKKKTGKKPTVHVNKAPSEREVQKAVKQASDRFARLGLVANILRGPGRERYDHFLKNGFPKWRGTGYYYTRFRPGLGSVLVGLFIFGGGAVHYGTLVLSYKRQQEFVDRYIRQARRAAWGNESAIGGIPGLDVAATPQPAAAEPEAGPIPRNRREKRMMEKGSKREKLNKKGAPRSGTATPDSGAAPIGQRKRVVAENGKVLIVDSTGNVFLEEEDEEGTTQEFLLDPDEIARPTIRDTALFKLPTWLYNKALSRFRRQGSTEGDLQDLDITLKYSGQEPDSGEDLIGNGEANPTGNGNSRKRNKKAGKSS